MILLVYFCLLFVGFAWRKGASPALTLLAIYLLSLFSGVPLGYDYDIATIYDVINVVFVAAMLTLMIAPWNAFSFRIALAEPNEKRVRRLTLALLAIHSLGFVIFSISFYAAITTVTDYSAFKSGGETALFYKDLPINHNLFLLATYLNSTATFLIPLHFYHLQKRRFLLSFLSLLLSLNLVLEGISIFSRSALIVYFVLYLAYLPFFYRRLDRVQRRLLNYVGLVVLMMFGAIFYEISNNRFADYLSSGDAVYSTSSIQNPVVYSLLDYAAQWYKNGNTVLSRYSFETLNGELSFPIVATVANKLGVINYSPDVIPIKLEALWGDRFDKFVGLIPNLVFDLGYVGTVLFVLLYAVLLRQIRPVRGVMSQQYCVQQHEQHRTDVP